MDSLQHSVVHRLPQSYRRLHALPGGSELQQVPDYASDDLIGLCLLSHQGEQAWRVMQQIQEALAEIQLSCSVVEWEGEPCLFVAREDELTTTCRLKNFGVSIAEAFSQPSA